MSRLSLARAAEVFTPPEGTVVVFGASADADLGAFDKARLILVQGRKPDHDHLVASGYEVRRSASACAAGQADMAVVLLPRAKAEALAMIAEAARVSKGDIVIDGRKDAGVDSILKALRKRRPVSGAWSKAHGKVFVVHPGEDAFDDWASPDKPQRQAFGYHTAPGVFSADGIDPASRLLAAALPESLGAHVVDLGAGWGYLAAQVLARESVHRIDLVEADHAALACAQLNITDPRAAFHWADATTWRPGRAAQTVVMNPPFHTGRATDPALGRAFIAAAAACLEPRGRLFMVANRHLPYEAALAQTFAEVRELPGDNRFKLFEASRPARPRG